MTLIQPASYYLCGGMLAVEACMWQAAQVDYVSRACPRESVWALVLSDTTSKYGPRSYQGMVPMRLRCPATSAHALE